MLLCSTSTKSLIFSISSVRLLLLLFSFKTLNLIEKLEFFLFWKLSVPTYWMVSLVSSFSVGCFIFPLASKHWSVWPHFGLSTMSCRRAVRKSGVLGWMSSSGTSIDGGGGGGRSIIIDGGGGGIETRGWISFLGPGIGWRFQPERFRNNRLRKPSPRLKKPCCSGLAADSSLREMVPSRPPTMSIELRRVIRTILRGLYSIT